MTTRQVPGVDELRPVPPESCPCGHGDLNAEIGQQRPLVAHAIQGDRAAFVVLYDEHVDDVYRYLLAWTWNSALAGELTEQVFLGALTWLPAIAEGEGELGAWLIALARDAVGQHRGAGWAGQPQPQGPPQDVFEAIEQLDDAQREVLVLRLLLGHSVTHAGHLAGYDTRVVQELQFGACATIWRLLSGVPLSPPGGGVPEDLRPRWFEQCLTGAALDPDADPGLSEALTVADALRYGSPEQVPLPDDAFVAQLRVQLMQSIGGGPPDVPPETLGRFGRAFATARHQIARHPWVATIVAAGAIGLVIGLQLAGGSPARSTCAGGACAPTTSAAAAAEGATPSLPAVGGPDEETSTTAALSAATSTTSRPSTTRTSASAPTTAPTTTVRRTTTTIRATTTTRRGKPPTTTQTTTTTAPQQAPTTTVGGGQALGG